MNGWTVVPSVIAAVALVVAAVVGQRMARGSQREMVPAQIIASLQARLTTVEGALVTERERADASLRRERLRDDYIYQLRDHIKDGMPPPPPPWPPGLTRQ